jgi:hypothetical protein
VQTFATLLFIAAVGGAGAYVASRPTIMDGGTLAADMQKQLDSKGVERVECPKEIRLTNNGATFTCTNIGKTGEKARIRYTMDRNGSYKGREESADESEE